MGKTKYESWQECENSTFLFAKLAILLATIFLLFFTIALFGLAWSGEIEDLHKKILYPTVRVRAGNGVGSGVIFSSILVEGKFQSYILTNHHVIKDAIQIKEEWSPLEKKEIKKETRATIEIEQFKYQHFSQATGTLLIQADIIEWSEQHDLALIMLRSDDWIEPIIRYPFGKESELRIFMDVYICGAGLGRPPFPTRGQISSLRDEINNLPFWMVSAPIVFGNSGGGAFLAVTKEYIGIPSQLSIAWVGWSPQAVYHMGYIIPVSRIYKWLDETGWSFIFNSQALSRKAWLEKQKKEKANDQRN